MEQLKPCPFCGNKMEGYPDYTISYKRDKKKIYGIYHEICTLKCNRCSCSIHQAGASREEAEKHIANLWNRRIGDGEFHQFCDKVRDWMTAKIDPMSKTQEEMTHKELYRSWIELWWWLDHYCEREPPKWGDEGEE